MRSYNTMRAAVVETKDGPFHIANIAKPRLNPGEVLVHIHASGVNPLDTKIRAESADHARHKLPAVLGLDMAGVIEAVAPDVTAFHAGDEVFGMIGGVGGIQGTLAEYAAVDADLLAIKPANLSMREAAALPLVTITAWEGLVDRARIEAGQTLLVQGGAGGIGHVAVQIGLACGAKIFATANGADADYLRSLGAIAIDYEKEPVGDFVLRYTGGEGFDLVFDTGGGAVLDASFQAVKRHGHVVSALGWGTHALAPLSFRGATYSGIFTLAPLLTGSGRADHGQILKKAASMVEAGKLLPRVDQRIFTLETVAQAHAAAASVVRAGKIVISLVED